MIVTKVFLKNIFSVLLELARRQKVAKLTL